MKGDRYIYRVSHMDDISNVKTFGSVVEVRKYTGLAEESVYSCFVNNKHIKGWIISRTYADRSSYANHVNDSSGGVVVYMKNGKTKTYSTRNECSKHMAISCRIIGKCIKEGTPDYKGNYYDNAI